MHTCPVCGYSRLEEPPRDFTICPSCGTEFGYDDAFTTVDQLRANWLRTGPRWWSTVDATPEGWDPYLQVGNVASLLWVALSAPEPLQQTPGMTDLFAPQRKQPQMAAQALSVFGPKQTYTPQAA